jgi:hypothetical protein
MLNEFLEDVYGFRNIEFEDLKIKEHREIHAACMQLV